MKKFSKCAFYDWHLIIDGLQAAKNMTIWQYRATKGKNRAFEPLMQRMSLGTYSPLPFLNNPEGINGWWFFVCAKIRDVT